MKRYSLGRRITKMQIILMVIMAFIISSCVYFGFRTVYFRFYNEKVQDVVRMTASQVDWEKLENFALSGKEDDYSKELKEYLDLVKENFTGVGYIYMFIPYEDHLMYVLEGSTEYDNPDNISSWGDTYDYTEYEYEQLLPDVQQGKASDTLHILNSELGFGVEAWAPVFDKEGNLRLMVEADYGLELINKDLNTFSISILGILLLCILIIATIIYFYLRWSVLRPLDALITSVKSYSHGNFSIDEKEFPRKDELYNLSESFENMTLRIEKYTEEVQKITAEKERIGAELGIATKIQADMLPKIFPAFPERGEFDIFATMTPAKEVGGDFYDFFMVDDDHMALVIADVSSKGVPAALFMVIAKTLIKDHTRFGISPEKVFEEVNNMLCEGNDEGMFVTAFMAIISLSTGDMTYVNAGHEPFLHRHDGKWSWIKPKSGFILAGLEDFEYTSDEMKLEPGDRLYMFTDGVSEAQNINNELFGDERITAAIEKYGDKKLSEVLAGIRKDIDEFAGEADQFDDITMLVFEYKGAASD